MRSGAPPSPPTPSGQMGGQLQSGAGHYSSTAALVAADIGSSTGSFPPGLHASRDLELAKFEAFLKNQNVRHIKANVRGRQRLAYPIKRWVGDICERLAG